MAESKYTLYQESEYVTEELISLIHDDILPVLRHGVSTVLSVRSLRIS